MTCGIVLAGGASSRMGQPKASLRLGAQTLAERMLALFEPFCDQVLMVTGKHHNEILACLPRFSHQIVFNEQHELGMFSSLRKGLEAIGDASTVLFSPVDFALVKPESIAALISVSGHEVVKPRWQGQSGHPVLIRANAIEALRAAPAESNAKLVLSQFPALYIDVEDPGVAQDCDTPEDYQRMLGEWKESA